MIEPNADPRRAIWSDVGGDLDDPAVRASRGDVRRRRRFPRLRARLRRILGL